MSEILSRDLYESLLYDTLIYAGYPHAADKLLAHDAALRARCARLEAALKWVADDMRYRAPEQAAGLYRAVWLAGIDAALAGGEK